MRLSKKHINQLFDVHGGDGSWIYQLVDVKRNKLLFYSFGRGEYYIEDGKKHHDWRPFEPHPQDKERIKWAWKAAKKVD